MDYEPRLLIPLKPIEKINLYTNGKLHICTSYRRVVIGLRGPYIEFDKSDLIFKNIFIPDNEKYRLEGKNYYYIEYRSIDASYVKVYFQKRFVDYADYLVGKYYISPFDLYFENRERVIKEK